MNTSINKIRFSFALLSLFALVAVPIGVLAVAYGQPVTISNPMLGENGYFGESVSIDGDRFVVGAPIDSTVATHAGSAYLYDVATGALLHTFDNPTPEAEDYFGSSVFLLGDRVLIGAYGDRSGSLYDGSVYLYDATTGALLHTFNHPIPTAAGIFGQTISMSGDRVLIGAHGDDTEAIGAGSVHLFDAVTGDFLLTFDNPTPNFSDQFGHSISISGDKVLIGKLQNDKSIADANLVYLFDATTGNLLRTFSNPNPQDVDHFGLSVSISDNKVLIGAYGDDTNAYNTGSAYLFEATTGALLRTFRNPTPTVYEYFGTSVLISGDRIIIDAAANYIGGIDLSSSYLFNAVTGDLLKTFNNPTPEVYDHFGFSASISSDRVLIGAYGDNAGAPDAGSVYLYLPLPDVDDDGIEDNFDNCPADANTNQTDIDGDGIGNVCDLTPPEEVEALVDLVEVFNLQQGISNNLDAKLDASLNALNDVNQNNDQAAINSLQAFISSVEAQRGNKITNEQADTLIAKAQAIIDSLFP
jgi:hypothetical protein